MSELRKRITIASSAPLPTYGGIMGPIRKPFYETISNISLLISSGAEVYEHIGDRRVKLNMVNFDSDNTEEQTEAASVLGTEKAETKSVNDESIIRIPSNPNKNQYRRDNKQKEKFYDQKVKPQVEELVVADSIVEE